MEKRIKNEKRNIIIFMIVIAITVFSIVYYFTRGNNSFNKYKVDQTKKIVYSVYDSGKTSVPAININNKDVLKLNDEIIDKANKFLSKDKNTITFDYDISGKILSLVIEYINYHHKSGYPYIEYDVYNINYETGKILSNDDILNLYKVNEDEVSSIIESKFGEYYNDLVEKKYINSDKCDYLCFLYLKGIINVNYMENYHYYIKNGNLYVIKEFIMYSTYHDEKYFSPKSSFIQITE